MKNFGDCSCLFSKFECSLLSVVGLFVVCGLWLLQDLFVVSS
jgi:hypothetical protein